ncbi:MAG: hypothetical protein H6R34_526, partial [Bacteroidetes bacterium]|nr:hypothetical protein [Bacteroidota bacterium]
MKKLLSIPKKLQYFALSLILFIATVLLIQIAANRYLANIRSAEQQIGFIKANIETINALHHELLSSIVYGKSDNPAVLDKSDKQMSLDLASLSESISLLSGNRIFKRNEDSFRSLETFTQAIADFSLANSSLLTTLKERGNVYEGMISAWLKQIADIEATVGTNNQDLLIGLGKMKALQAEYLMTMNSSL